MKSVLSVLFVGWAAALSAAPARLASVAFEVAELEKGAFVFADRTFTLNDVPEALKGETFLRTTIDGTLEVVVEGAGELTILTPVKGSFVSQSKAVSEAGFVRRTDVQAFQLFGTSSCDVVEAWTKSVKAGERFSFDKWCVVCGLDRSNQTYVRPASERRIAAKLLGTPNEKYAQDILINHPDYVVFIPRQSRDPKARDDARPGDTYNDHFQVINDNRRGLLYAFWTQASKEADVDQHIAFSKSADKGLTWTEPVIIAGSPNKRNPGLLASWQQPMLSKSGRLYCLWNQQTTSRGPHCGQMFGAYSDDGGETWSAPKMTPFAERMDADDRDPLVPPCWCNWQRPLRLGEGGRFFVGCSRHGKASYDDRWGCKIEFWQYENIDDNPNVEDIRIGFFAKNKDALAAPALEGIGGFRDREPAIEEAGIVKLPDGRLFAMMRSSVGSPVWSQSRDGGRTWSRPKILLDRDGGTPYLHSRSPCPIYDWKGPEAGSGRYFAVVHNKFDFKAKSAYQDRGPLYLIAGTFQPDAEQPIWFKAPKMFAPRPHGNSFYTSYCLVDGKGVLWFNDMKFYLLGRVIGPEWFE